MNVAIGADHAGFELKTALAHVLQERGIAVLDLGTDSAAAVDYPDFARAVGHAVIDGRAERGLLVCGSGVGACIAANKIRGIRAGTCHDTFSARQGVEDDDMNVLCVGARVIGLELAKEITAAFLCARFSGVDRHVRRRDKVLNIEADGR